MSEQPTGNQLPQTPWTVLDSWVHEYVNDYELRDAEDAQGRTCDYAPNEFERGLIADAINGLFGDDDFARLMTAAWQFTREARIAEGSCPDCGSPTPQHYGNCKGAAK